MISEDTAHYIGLVPLAFAIGVLKNREIKDPKQGKKAAFEVYATFIIHPISIFLIEMKLS